MVSTLVSELSTPGLSRSPERCVVLTMLGKTLYSHSASLHPGVYMGVSEFTAGG